MNEEVDVALPDCDLRTFAAGENTNRDSGTPLAATTAVRLLAPEEEEEEDEDEEAEEGSKRGTGGLFPPALARGDEDSEKFSCFSMRCGCTAGVAFFAFDVKPLNFDEDDADDDDDDDDEDDEDDDDDDDDEELNAGALNDSEGGAPEELLLDALAFAAACFSSGVGSRGGGERAERRFRAVSIGVVIWFRVSRIRSATWLDAVAAVIAAPEERTSAEEEEPSDMNPWLPPSSCWSAPRRCRFAAVAGPARRNEAALRRRGRGCVRAMPAVRRPPVWNDRGVGACPAWNCPPSPPRSKRSNRSLRSVVRGAGGPMPRPPPPPPPPPPQLTRPTSALPIVRRLCDAGSTRSSSSSSSYCAYPS